MKRIILVLIFFTTAMLAKGQMNFQDSTVQAILYWNLGDKYEYAVSLQKLKFTETDTITNETITYDVEVSVIDSTEKSYTIRWFYKSIKSDSKDPIVVKLVTAAEDIAVDIKTDELGVIQSVENWEKVRDYMAESLDLIKSDIVQSGFTKVFEKMKQMYSSKSAIEASAIQDAQQFHNFNGGKYAIHEVATGQVKFPNLYESDKPFDTDLTVTLEKMDAENNYYIIRSIVEVNSEQLTETTYNHLKKNAEEKNQPIVKREDFDNLSATIETVSRIHNTGWVLYSALWKEVFTNGVTNLEKRKIEMK